MKNKTTILLILTISQFAFGNRIDSLSGDKEVEKFVKEVNKVLSSFEFDDINKAYHDSTVLIRAKQLNVENFIICDLTNDRYQDLLVYGKLHGKFQPIVIAFEPKTGKYRYFLFRRNPFRSLYLASIQTVDSTNILMISEYFIGRYNDIPVMEMPDGTIKRLEDNRSDWKDFKLIYKFDNFIEYNPNPDFYPIESVTFKTSGCYGPCEIFKVKLNQFDTIAYFKISDHKGKEIKTINKKLEWYEFQEISNILNYIDFTNFEPYYTMNWTDDQSISTEIVYQDEEKIKSKRTSDYAKLGTYGLMLIYKKIYEIRGRK